MKILIESIRNKNVFTYLKRVASLTWTIAKFYAFFHVTKTYIIPIDVVVAQGSSMIPSINDNDILLAEKVSVRRKHLKR